MLDAIKSRLRALFRKQQMERDLDEELRYHLNKAIDQNLRRGMTPEEARRAAIAGFGGLDRQKEGCRDARGIRVIEESWRDLRYAGRLLVKRPAFTLAVVVTLALGIGANTAVFSVADAMLLRPLPFKDQGRLAWLSAKVPNGPFFAVSDDQFSAWQNRNHTLDGIGAWANDSVNLTGYGEPERVSCSDVSDGLFSCLGVRPVIGRDFTAVDEKLEKGSLVMIGERLWESRFGESPAAIGQSIALNGKVYSIIGVAPRSIDLLDRDEVFIALGPTLDALRRDHPGTLADVSVIGRLKPGITRQAAVDDLDRILAEKQAKAPVTKRSKAVVVSLREHLTGETRPALIVLIGAVAFVLLIACVNVANLLLARAPTRETEVAIKAALGAGRLRLFRQMAVESLLLALIGGATGLLLAYWGIRALTMSLPETFEKSIDNLQGVGLDWRTLGFTLSISLLTGVLFGLAPAIAASKVRLSQTIGKSGRWSSSGPTSKKVREVLAVAEVALSVVSLAGAGLMVRSFILLTAVNPGFADPARLLTLQVRLPESRYLHSEQVREFYRDIVEHARGLKGVRSVALINSLPLEGFGFFSVLTVEGNQVQAGTRGSAVPIGLVSSDCFSTLGTALVKGRPFGPQDAIEAIGFGLDESAPPGVTTPVIVNETFARTYWPNQNPLGKRISGTGRNDCRVVGIVSDVKQRGLAAAVKPQMFFNGVDRSMYLVVRTESDPKTLIPALRAQINALDNLQPISLIRTMDEYLSESVAETRSYMSILAAFALISLILASVGIYGVISYSVTERTHELGVRMALGATGPELLRMILRRAIVMLGIGIFIGLGGALGLGRLISAYLYGVTNRDAPTFLMISIILAIVGLAACLIPARRAARLDPIGALRYE